MVGEFPELQGIMGGYYSQLKGHPKEVSDAIFERWQNQFFLMQMDLSIQLVVC